jgi:hypothetical protein
MLSDFHKRMLLFLIGCIGTRAAIAYAAKVVSPSTLQIMGGLALLPAIGFLYLVFVSRRDTGPEVLGGRIWWQKLRLVHAGMYALFAVMALMKIESAWKVLAVDVLFGLGSFLAHHFSGWNP